MRVWQAIGIAIIIVLVLMWVDARNDAIQLEQESEETWRILERRQQHQANELYRLEKEHAWERDQRQLEEALRETRDNLGRDRGW